ncbi:MAG: carboxypeptidase-like regulatory domain-containing protein, partial [Bacteroidales bacterium]|nr:carboxypeptidase-like regulatory domain-containing protein [Bacteroidales bacterium]
MRHLTFILILLLFAGFTARAQQEVSGTVTNAESGEPIPGVTIIVKSQQTIGTTTDMDGNYTLTGIPEDAETLVFSFVGMETQEVAIQGRGQIDVQLKPAAQELEEVVVTALGIEREKKALGYSVDDVSGESISKSMEDNVVNQLSGRVSGVNFIKSAAGPGSGTRVTIRGNNSLTGNNEPLYVVDGVPIDNSGFGSADGPGTANYNRTDYGTGISDIDPNDIESISVLKGPNAAALYGSRASNGVILITTKTGEGTTGLGVTYNVKYTFADPLLLPDYQNQYGQGTQGNYPNDLSQLRQTGGSWGPKMEGSERLYWNGETRPYEAQSNNIENFFRTGSNMVNNLSLEYGSKDYSLRFAYSNTESNSILENSGLSKNNFTLRGNAQLDDKLSVDAKATYFIQEAKHRPSQGTEGIMAHVYT